MVADNPGERERKGEVEQDRLGLRVDNADKPATDAVNLGAVQAVGRVGNIADVVPVAGQVGEGRPPLLWSRGLGESADRADQLHPDRLAGAGGARLRKPGRRIRVELGELRVGHRLGDAVAVRHLKRNIEAEGNITAADHPPRVPVPTKRPMLSNALRETS